MQKTLKHSDPETLTPHSQSVSQRLVDKTCNKFCY